MRRLLFLLPALLLASCVYPPWTTQAALTCEQIAWLQQQVGTIASLDGLRDSIHEEFALPLETIEARAADGTVVNDNATHFVTWTDQRKLTYRAYLDAQGQIIQMGVGDTDTPGDQLFACLGQSSYYYTETTWEEVGPARFIMLFFPLEGVGTKGWQYLRQDVSDPKSIPVVNGQFKFDSFVFVAPQSAEQIMKVGWPGYARENILTLLKPWPGAWAKIEFPPFPK